MLQTDLPQWLFTPHGLTRLFGAKEAQVGAGANGAVWQCGWGGKEPRAIVTMAIIAQCLM